MTGTIRCPSCGVAIESDASSCPFCGATVRPESKEIATGEDRKVHRATHRDRAAEAMTRYSEGYLYARTINGLGSFIQVVSCLVGGLLVLGGLFACLNSSQNNPFAGQLGAASGTIMAISGVVVGFLGYVKGVIIKAGAQFLKAHFDCAVNQSHFLNDDQRAEVMSME